MSRAARFGAVMATLWAAHNVGDHLLQTDHQASGKAAAKGWVGPMAGHVGSYHAAQVAALITVDRALGLGLRPGRVAAAVALSAGTHAFLDRRWPVRWLLQHTGSPDFADLATPINGPYVADQSCHHAVLFWAALIATGGDD